MFSRVLTKMETIFSSRLESWWIEMGSSARVRDFFNWTRHISVFLHVVFKCAHSNGPIVYMDLMRTRIMRVRATSSVMRMRLTNMKCTLQLNLTINEKDVTDK